MQQRLEFFQPSSSLRTAILVNYIYYDGIGDFYHFLDIVQRFAVFAARLKVELIPLIICEPERREMVQNKISELGLGLKPIIFECNRLILNSEERIASFDAFVHHHHNLRQALQQALSIFQISTGTSVEDKDCLLKFCRPGIPVVSVSEYIRLLVSTGLMVDPRDVGNKTLVNINDRFMGFSSEKNGHRYGIKMEEPLSMTKEEALLTIQNTQFVRALLGKNDDSAISQEDVKDFLNNNYFIPLYMQNYSSIWTMIFMCLQHPDFSKKNIVFYSNNYQGMFLENNSIMLIEEEDFRASYPDYDTSNIKVRENRSGERLLAIKSFEYNLLTYYYENVEFKDPDISSMELNVNGERQTISFHSISSISHSRTVSILTDFDLNDQDYSLMTSLATSFVGFSGDSSFSKLLSLDKLPFLQSDGKSQFVSMLNQLNQLSKHYLSDNPESVLTHIEALFGEKYAMCLYFNSIKSSLLNVDLNLINKYWPVVMNGLRKDHNIYNHLNHIFYEALMHMSATIGDIDLLMQIYQNFPELDLMIPNKKGETVCAIAKANHHWDYVDVLVQLMEKKRDESNCEATLDADNLRAGL